jgi:hypothetical protein
VIAAPAHRRQVQPTQLVLLLTRLPIAKIREETFLSAFASASGSRLRSDQPPDLWEPAVYASVDLMSATLLFERLMRVLSK